MAQIQDNSLICVYNFTELKNVELMEYGAQKKTVSVSKVNCQIQ